MTKEKAPSFHGMIESMEREAFERDMGAAFGPRALRRNQFGGYEYSVTLIAWEAWQDRAALASKASKADHERICNALPGGYSVDPQWVADMVLGMVE